MNKRIKVGNLILNSCVSLAPMAGITDFVFRDLIRLYSKNCLITTEMISSEALVNKPKTEIIKRSTNHSPIAFQLSGHKPHIMAKAAKILEKSADIIDINMGCPVKKVVGGNDGCALMKSPQLACDIVKAIKDNIQIPVSVKFRLGWDKQSLNFIEFAKLMENSGADMITIHARTRAQMYSGKADWELISKIKNEIKIPYFANGDIKSVENAIKCLEITKADAIAIGRGVLGYPQLTADIENTIYKGIIASTPTLEQRIDVLKLHIKKEIEFRGELAGLQFMRKFYPYYINNIACACKLRAALMNELSLNVIIKLLDEILKNE